MNLLPFQETVFYSIEKTIKTYRRYAQSKILAEKVELTINQALLLNLLSDNSDLDQKEMAAILFKDLAAITRMMELMVKNGFVERHPNPKDRRKHILKLTEKGKAVVNQITPITKNYRADALKGFTPNEIKELHRLLEKLIANCLNH